LLSKDPVVIWNWVEFNTLETSEELTIVEFVNFSIISTLFPFCRKCGDFVIIVFVAASTDWVSVYEILLWNQVENFLSSNEVFSPIYFNLIWSPGRKYYVLSTPVERSEIPPTTLILHIKFISLFS